MSNPIYNQDEDQVRFIPEDGEVIKGSPLSEYKILIVDDEEEVHKITRLTLRDLIVDGHSLTFLSAYSMGDAKAILKSHEDIAVILVDVVMETNGAGLELVKFIREELGNRMTRIILRTGQPGAAPEEKVILDYDINDYKSKTELTSQKLMTSIIACIRGYRDITLIDKNRQGLRQIINSTAYINDFQDKSMALFYGDMLDQLMVFHRLSGDAPDTAGLIIVQDDAAARVIAATGHFSEYMNHPAEDLERCQTLSVLCKGGIGCQEELVFAEGCYTLCHKGFEDTYSVIHVQCGLDIQQDMIQIFLSNITQAIDNYTLNRNILVTEREIISTLSEIVEKRDLSTAHHIKRVSEYAETMSHKIGLDHETCKRIKIACMMHDVGKIGISDQILLKPDILDQNEYEMIKEHAAIGHRILQNSSLPIMKIAAEIALNHHERWDGTGYPNQLKEWSIPLNARMISLLDVFDALTHRRIYKDAWTLEDALDFIQEQSGKMFDPALVGHFFEALEEIKMIWHTYPDDSGT